MSRLEAFISQVDGLVVFLAAWPFKEPGLAAKANL
jgi:hypothetical protein